MTELQKEDYAEPVCPFCTTFYSPDDEAPTVTVPIGRVMEKLDRYFAVNDLDGAERHLLSWLKEAQEGKDRRAELSLRNELIGFYRKNGNEKEATEQIQNALFLLHRLKMEDSITAGTTFLNIATAYKAFGKSGEALSYYEKALALYEKNLAPNDERFGGLYNNTALALADEKRYDEAETYYQKALGVMDALPFHEPECAITLLNLADLCVLKNGVEASERKTRELCETAWEYLNRKTVKQDGNYAYVCEKCAPVFGGFGFFLYENELKQRAEKIYAGN